MKINPLNCEINLIRMVILFVEKFLKKFINELIEEINNSRIQ